jgi:hypothetical protein
MLTVFFKKQSKDLWANKVVDKRADRASGDESAQLSGNHTPHSGRRGHWPLRTCLDSPL